MTCITPTRRFECSDKYLLKRVHMCTEFSFERTPTRNGASKRKNVQFLSSTLSSGITLLSQEDVTLVGDQTLVNSTLSTLERTLTENNQQNILDDTTLTTPWEIIDSMNSDGSNFSVITMNQSDASQATVISKRSTKGSTNNRPASLLSRILKPSTPKSSNKGVKYVNRCVRDIDRLNDTFGQEWITLPNFV